MAENSSRAFLYGESVFSTMRMINGNLANWDLHFERMKKGVEFLYGPFLDNNWEHVLKQNLMDLLVSENGDKVIRLAIYREKARGLGRAELISVHQLKVSMMAEPYEPGLYEKRLALRCAPVMARPTWWPNYLKAGSYLETIMAQKVYLKPEDDDLLFYNERGEILESSVANIFVVRNNKLYTAPLGPNVLDGIMRRKVIDAAPMVFRDCIEKASTRDQLQRADGIFGTNSVRGPFLIGRVDDREFSYSSEFLELFNKLRSIVLE